jgi:hypothetical protein
LRKLRESGKVDGIFLGRRRRGIVELRSFEVEAYDTFNVWPRKIHFDFFIEVAEGLGERALDHNGKLDRFIR